MDNQKPTQKPGDDYYTYGDNDLQLADRLCQLCVFENPQEPGCCRKYPDGKPMEVLDPDYVCPLFSMFEFD